MASKEDVESVVQNAWDNNHVKRLILAQFEPRGNSVEVARQMKAYLKEADLQLAAIRVTEAEDKKNLLLLAGGKYIRDVNESVADPAQGDAYAKLTNKLKTHYRVNDLEIYSRNAILNLTQRTGQSFQDYYTTVLMMATDCNYNATEKDKIVRDIILKGVINDKIRRTALEKSQNLNDLVSSANSIEHAAAQNTMITQNKASINKVNFKRNNNYSYTPASNKGHQGNNKCYFCGGSYHPRDQCRAKDAQCRKCHKTGHFQTVCKSKGQSQGHKSFSSKTGKKKYHTRQITEECPEAKDGPLGEPLYINHVSV